MERKIEVGFRVLSGTEQADLPEPIEQTVIIAGRSACSIRFDQKAALRPKQLPKQIDIEI